MKLKIYGSSSAGNCYVLEGKTESLMIEAGVNLRNVAKEMGMGIAQVVGCLITHEHGDHAKFAEMAASKYSIRIYCSQGTADALNIKNTWIAEPNRLLTIGNFKVVPWNAMHDAAQPLGFLIWHEEMGWMLFATDTYCIPVSVNGIKHLVIECNYAEDILEANYNCGLITKGQYNRTFKSHMSLEGCKQYIQSQDLRTAWDITLIHLSDGNSNEERFISEIQEVAGAGINVIAAPKTGLKIIELYK